MAETKAIADEGFIYDLPIVINYAVMYEYAVDKNSGQYKSSFNQIKNEARVYPYKDTAIETHLNPPGRRRHMEATKRRCGEVTQRSRF